MFSTWNGSDTGSSAGLSSFPDIASNIDPSRSPATRPVSSRSYLLTEAAMAMTPEKERRVIATSASVPSWSTGIQQCDAWLRTNILDDHVLNSFGAIPLRHRMLIVLKAIENPKNNPVAWIAACVLNHRTHMMEKRLTIIAASPRWSWCFGTVCSTVQVGFMRRWLFVRTASAFLSQRCSSRFKPFISCRSNLCATQFIIGAHRHRRSICVGLGSRDMVQQF